MVLRPGLRCLRSLSFIGPQERCSRRSISTVTLSPEAGGSVVAAKERGFEVRLCLLKHDFGFR